VSRAPFASALLAAALGCAHAPAPPPPAAPPRSDVGAPPAPGTAARPAPRAPAAAPGAADRLGRIRADVDRLLTAQGNMLWETWTRGAVPNVEASLAASDALSAHGTLELVRAARDGSAGDERRALALLHAFLVGEHLAREAAAAPEPAAGAALSWDGRAVATARVPALLAAEPDPARRAALEHAWAEAERRHAPAAAARWQAIAAAARRLGYDSLLALAVELRGANADGLAAFADGVLATTDAGYRALLDALGRLEMGKGLADLRGRDLPRLLRAGEDPRAFPAARLAADAQGTLAALGLDLAARPGLVVDAEARAGKDPRALTLPVEVPGSVRVSYAPAGGAAELRALLHELGAAAFYASVTTPVLEFRRLGAVTAETWAALFEDLAGDPAWLAERTGLADTHLAPLVRAAAARRLQEARTLAARILVEIARARAPEKAAAAAKGILERAFARPVDADELDLFLLDRDPLLESAERLQSLLLAAQVQAFLTDRAPPAWWRSKESGAWLAAAFAEGSRRTPADLASALGAPALDAAVLDAVTRERAEMAGVRRAASPDVKAER